MVETLKQSSKPDALALTINEIIFFKGLGYVDKKSDVAISLHLSAITNEVYKN